MWKRLWTSLIIAMLVGAAGPGRAEDFAYLGMTSLSYNDRFGDGDDRWQTGGGSLSFLFGPEGQATLPARFGTLFELRITGQVITPDNYTAPARWDRPAAAVVTTTLNTHFELQGYEMAFGAGVAVTGPQTGLIRFQNFIHDLTPGSDPHVPGFVQDAQIADGYYMTAQGEAARRFELAEEITARPFIQAQAGVESFARAGVDFYFGSGFDSGVLIRDAATGFNDRALGEGGPGVSLTFGADVARVFNSALLPASQGYTLTPLRTRVRAGMLVEDRYFSVFQGVSWLGPEFTAQPTGQAVGVLQFKLKF